MGFRGNSRNLERNKEISPIVTIGFLRVFERYFENIPGFLYGSQSTFMTFKATFGNFYRFQDHLRDFKKLHTQKATNFQLEKIMPQVNFNQF